MARPSSPPGSVRTHPGRTSDVPIGADLIHILVVAYRARRPLLLEGGTGIGKSEIVRQVARALGIQCIVLDLSLLEPPDLLGLPQIAEGRTVHAPPTNLPTSGAGILMLEELNRAERYMQQPAMQLLSARALNSYTLPDGWCCFAAINPELDDADYQVTPLDPALRARFLNMRVRADRVEWVRWAQDNGVHPAVLAVAKSLDGFLADVPPRTWSYVSEVLHVMTPDELGNERLLRHVLCGYLPVPWAEALQEALENSGMDLGIDLYAAIASLEKSAEACAALRLFCEEGETDRLTEIATRLAGIVEGAEMAALSGRGEFDLGAFETLIAGLPGDHREFVQETFAENPISAQLVGLTPAEVLERYHTGARPSLIQELLADRNRQHRVWSLAWNLPGYLRKQGRLAELRRSNPAKGNLGRFAADLGDHAAPLIAGLKELGITQIIPADRRKR
jgi:hypothetical protein